MGTMSQWYVDNLRNETTKGKRERFQQGFYNGDLHFGYSKGEDDKPTPNSDADGVLLAFELCAQGATDGEIAVRLNQAGYCTYRLIENCKKKAGPEVDLALRRPWTKDSVASLLKNGQFYLSNIEYVGEAERKRLSTLFRRGEQYKVQVQVNKGTHKAIITQELYDRAIAARNERTNHGRVPNTRVRVYLMSGGLAVCNTSGLPLRCTNAGKDKRLQYYQCPAHFRGMSCDALRDRIREDRLLVDIEEMISLLVLPDDWRDHTRELLAIVPTADELTSGERRKSEIIEALRRLVYQHQLGLISDQDLANAVAPLKTEQQQLIAKLKVMAPQVVEAQGEQLIKFHSSWLKANKEQRRDMLALLFVAIHVDVNNGVIESFEPYPDFKVLLMQTGMIEREGQFYLPTEGL
jgi:Recombinase